MTRLVVLYNRPADRTRRLLRAVVCVLLSTAASDLWSQTSGDFILAARRSGTAEIIDSVTLETLARVRFDFKVERLSGNADPFKIDIAGYAEGQPCCKEYTLNLATLKMDRMLPNRRSDYGPPLVSPDGRWRARLKSFRGPAVRMDDLTTGATRELVPAGLPLDEDRCGGNWAAQGSWSVDRFNFYTACPDHPGILWTVLPEATELGIGVAVDPFNEASDCQPRLPIEKRIAAAGRNVFLFEPFGGKLARSCQSSVAGGAWMVDQATGHLIGQIAPQLHFSTLQPDRSGATLYGVALGNAGWAGPVQLVRLNAQNGEVLKSRVLDRGVLQIAVAPLGMSPAGDMTDNLSQR